jgi:pyridinium-3,5-biscarboxylic acid mononucleotide sulfurtransferase
VINLENSNKKCDELEQYILEKGKDGVLIAFSGGVDSSTLAAVAHKILGPKAIAVTAQSQTYTKKELSTAKETAREIGIKHIIIETNEISDEKFNSNPENRCYYCKKELLQAILKKAKELNFKAVFEGTNYSDLAEHRPGFDAVKETRNVYSPWFETGFTKTEIRELAKKIGLSAHDRMAHPCLATRIPYHEKITVEKLTRIEAAEDLIKELTGAKLLRVRDHNGIARIEVGKEERKLFFNEECLDKISSDLTKLGFTYVTFDIAGYQSGSMLRGLRKPIVS